MRISDWSSDVCSSDLVLREWSAHGSIASTVDWLTALRRYLVAITVGNLVWEFAHLPLYTIWYEGTPGEIRSEEHTSELQSLMRISYAVFCLKKTINTTLIHQHILKHQLTLIQL